jgi:hypothetical protein
VNFDTDVISGVKNYLDEWYFVGISSGAIISWTKEYLEKKSGLKWVIMAPDWWDFYMGTLMTYLEKKDFIWKI